MPLGRDITSRCALWRDLFARARRGARLPGFGAGRSGSPATRGRRSLGQSTGGECNGHTGGAHGRGKQGEARCVLGVCDRHMHALTVCSVWNDVNMDVKNELGYWLRRRDGGGSP